MLASLWRTEPVLGGDKALRPWLGIRQGKYFVISEGSNQKIRLPRKWPFIIVSGLTMTRVPLRYSKEKAEILR